MTEVRIRSRYLRQVYEAAYARHLESERLGLEQYHRTWSSRAGSVQDERGSCSPLGGQAVDKSEEPQR